MDGLIVNAAKSTLARSIELAAAEQAQREAPSSPSVRVNSELEIKSSLPSRTVTDSNSLIVVAALPCASDRAGAAVLPVWQKTVNPSRPPVPAQLGSH